jgi:hypothetical protein
MVKKLLIILLSICLTTVAYTTEPEFKILEFPVGCSSKDKMEEYLQSYNFKLQSVSLLREEQQSNGEPLLVVEYYLNTNKSESVIIITTLDNKESCMIGRTFNLKEYKVKKGEPT